MISLLSGLEVSIYPKIKDFNSVSWLRITVASRPVSQHSRGVYVCVYVCVCVCLRRGGIPFFFSFKAKMYVYTIHTSRLVRPSIEPYMAPWTEAVNNAGERAFNKYTQPNWGTDKKVCEHKDANQAASCFCSGWMSDNT